VTPPLLVGVGIAALALGAAILRTFGPGFRIGRLLSAAPRVTVGDALALAASGRDRYVRIDGRVDAADPFEDEHGRPLVIRRVRLEAREGGRWRSLDTTRRGVPFSLDEGLDSLAVDEAALDEGLVVIPRESTGRAGDAPDALPPGLDAATEVRLRIEQLSTVDHAIVCGVPRIGPDGAPVLTAGLGRPLVLTNLGRDDAIRLLAGGSRARPLAAGIALAAGILLIVAGLVASLAAPSPVAGAEPTASPGAAEPSTGPGSEGDRTEAGDTRSSGVGPSFIGEPLLAIGGVLGLGIATLLVTLAWVRLTGGRRSDDPPDGAPPGAGPPGAGPDGGPALSSPA
jgi:hypothetical protein